MADTDDAKTNLALLPDWGKRIAFVQQFDGNVTRSFGGKEQRSARRVRPTFRLEYFRSGLTVIESRRRLQEIRGEFNQPLIVPIWPDGVLLDGDMTNPVSDDVVDQIFDFMVRDFSRHALSLYSKPSSSETQMASCLKMIRKPVLDEARYQRVWQQVHDLQDEYEMAP